MIGRFRTIREILHILTKMANMPIVISFPSGLDIYFQIQFYLHLSYVSHILFDQIQEQSFDV